MDEHIKKLALENPIVRSYTRAFLKGWLTYEQALEGMVISLSASNRVQLERIMELRAEQPITVIVNGATFIPDTE